MAAGPPGLGRNAYSWTVPLLLPAMEAAVMVAQVRRVMGVRGDGFVAKSLEAGCYFSVCYFVNRIPQIDQVDQPLLKPFCSHIE